MISKNFTCIMILSDKSSGSSILQTVLTKHPYVKNIDKTRHNAHETLFWNKAVALLGLPQKKMEYSELPISKERARKDLEKILLDNLGNFESCNYTKEWVFNGWLSLCMKYGHFFVEKSPHHLHYWSALELILQFRERNPNVVFKFIGLIRNPIDTLYSMYKRWGVIPERRQFEWLRAYKNLLKFKDIVKDDLLLVKYEELVNNINTIQSILRFVGLEPSYEMGNNLHKKSLHKWKKDTLFGFKLAPEVFTFAQQFYDTDELENSPKLLWNIVRVISEIKYKKICLKLKIKTFLQLSF